MTKDQSQDLPQEEKTPEALLQEYLDGWKRERAAFENYRKDETQRLIQVRVHLMRGILAKLLPILDSFELALKATPEDAKNSDWFKGYTFIKKQFEDMLKEEGIQSIDTHNQVFDPYVHEAIETQDNASGDGPLIVLEELQKGYQLGDTVLRPARVRVGKKGGGNV